MALACQFLGIVSSKENKNNDALYYFKHFNQLEKELHESHPNNIEFKKLFAISYYKLYEIYLKMNQKTEAKTNLLRAVGIFKALKNNFPSYIQFSQFYNIAKNNLKELEK